MFEDVTVATGLRRELASPYGFSVTAPWLVLNGKWTSFVQLPNQVANQHVVLSSGVLLCVTFSQRDSPVRGSVNQAAPLCATPQVTLWYYLSVVLPQCGTTSVWYYLSV